MSETESAHYERRPDGVAACGLCPHRCQVAPGERGRCRVRQNLSGVLYTSNYEEAARLEVEAIERIPLYHFRPGARVLALGAFGDSFPAELVAPSCLSGAPAESRFATAREIVDIAASARAGAIACAGGEPFMWLEQWREVGTLARNEGLAIVAMTNGFALPPAVADAAALTDAVNLYILGPAEVYRRRLQADRAPVIEAAQAFRAAGAHLELTLLVLAGENDHPAALDDLVATAESLGRPPVHVSSPFHADTAAPVKSVRAVYEALRPRLPHVYLSTVYPGAEPNTLCPACKAVLVERMPMRTAPKGLAPDGTCAACGAPGRVRL
jgi:pyruvate formate lyase activating enzyme